MGLVKSNSVLHTTLMEGKDILDKYYKVSKARLDTIKSHSKNPGYHRTLYNTHFNKLVFTKGYNMYIKLAAFSKDGLTVLKAEAVTSSSTYIACLLLMMVDKRYKPVNIFLRETLLVCKQ